MPFMNPVIKSLAEHQVAAGRLAPEKARAIVRRHFRQEVSLVGLVLLSAAILVIFAAHAGGA